MGLMIVFTPWIPSGNRTYCRVYRERFLSVYACHITTTRESNPRRFTLLQIGCSDQCLRSDCAGRETTGRTGLVKLYGSNSNRESRFQLYNGPCRMEGPTLDHPG